MSNLNFFILLEYTLKQNVDSHWLGKPVLHYVLSAGVLLV